MNQSTSFAQVATNQFDYLSSDLCANTPPCKKHSSSRKFLTLSISLRLLLVMFLTLSVSAEVWGATATLTLSSSKKFGTTSGSTLTDDQNNTWTCNGSSIQNAYNTTYKGQQFGTSKNAGNYTFACTIAGATISSVKITAAAGSTNAKYSISVGGSSKYSGNLSKTSTTYGGTNASGSGEISISLQGSGTGAAVYLGSITVVYTTASATKHTVTFNAGSNGTCSTPSLTEASAGAGVKLPDVTPNSGYRFLGWATTSSATTADAGTAGETYKPASNITLHAVYKQQCTVNWLVDDNAATGSPTTIVDKGGKVTTLPTTPTLECSGKVFVGWSNQEVTDGNKPSVLFTTAANSPAINDHTPFYAVFATETGGGSTTDTYDWESTSTGNWLIDESIVRTANQGVSSSYAGKINTNNTYVTYNKKVAVTNFSFQFKRTSTNSNYNVYIETSTDKSNWSTAATYAMNTFGNGSYTSKSQTFDGNTELYVRFHCYNTTAVRYVDNVSISYSGGTTYSDYTTSCTSKTVVTLDPNGGTLDPELEGWGKDGDIYTKEVDGSVELPTPTKTGYNFDGWYDGETKVNSPYTPSETVILVAKWKAKQTQLSINTNTANHGSGSGFSVVATYGEALPNFNPCTPATGYTLNGYYTAATDGTKIIDKDGKLVSNVSDYTSADGKWASEAEQLILYAQYIINTYTVKFDNQGHGSKPDDQTINHGGKVNNPGNLTENGFIFGGWYKESGCTSAWDFENDVVTSSITLYAKWTAKTATSLTWLPTSYSATIDADNTFPTLTKTPDDLSPIAYSSSNTGVATIDANTGDITLVAAGTTTITATFTETNTHAGSTASYTLTVNPSNCRWVEVTDNTTLEDGDWVVIAMANGENIYALPNNKGTSTPDGILLDILDGNKINTVGDYLKWTVEKTEGNYIFHPNGNNAQWLYCINSDDGVRVGTGAAKAFILDPTTGYLANTQTNPPRYLRLGRSDNINYVWRCYTTNTAGQTLKFYKRECLDATKVWVEGNLTNVTCTPQLPQQLAKNSSLELTFTAADGYELPNTVTVTNATESWNQATGKLTISNPIGNVMVTVEAVKYYTITWKPAGGNWSGDTNDKVVKYEAGDKIVAPATPTYDCHEFLGWTPAYLADMTMPAENLEFTATWNKLSYTITFKNYDGTVLQTSTVECGETPSYTGATPTREQTAQYTYTFKGWSPTIAPATQDQVYTAKFDEVTRSYTVTWMVGTTEYTAGTPTSQVEYDKKVTNLPTSPQDDAIGTCANKFIGWSTKSSGSNAENADYYDDLFTTAENSPAITDATTFYAVFATEEAGGGEQTAQVFATSSLGNSNSVTTGFTISAEADKKDGYYQDGSGTKRYVQVMKSDVSTPMITVTPTSLTVTAKLGGGTEKNPLTNSVYAILLDADGNELGSAVVLTNKITAKTGSDFTASLPVANATDAYGVRVYHQKETSYNVRYYAISLSYKYNNTTYSNYVTSCCETPAPTNGTFDNVTGSGNAMSLTLNWEGSAERYHITGGNLATEGIYTSETSYTVNNLTECEEYIFNVTAYPEDGCESEAIAITAQPFSGAKTVTFNYNGNGQANTTSSTSCGNTSITLPTPTRTGYTFNGWYTDATGGTRVGGAGDIYEPATSPVTLHAQWTIKSYTVTWNPNGGKWGESTSNIVETYEYDAAINTPADPTRENGIFKGWNPSVPSNMPAGNQIYTAQWEMVYTLTFVDMNAGGTTSTLTQTSSGQDIVAPTANSEVCDMWTFIGWAPSNSLNGGTDKPTGFIAAGETIPGSQITGNKTYYSVYSYNSDNTQEFEVGKSGTYFMYAISGTTKYYATTVKTSNTAFYANTESDMSTYSSKKSTFILTYNTNTTKYVIKHINTTADKESEGYFYQADPTKKDITVNSSSSSSFEIAKGETQGSYRIKFTYTANSNTVTGNFGQSSSSFQGYAEGYDIFFEPASEIQYYNAADCGEVETYTMSFHNPFGDENALVWNDAEHEEAYYTDQPLNTSIDVFPTMVYNGWTFMGWTANQQYNDLIGEEKLDDENSATDDPASSCTLYSNTTGWAYTLNSNVTMYPVFTKFEDNEPFDMINGGDYYIYYIADADVTTSVDEYGVANRIYAGGWEAGGTSDSYGATQSCSNATLFTFTKQSNDKWTIYDNTNRKYLCAGTTDNNLALNATPATNGEWTITVHDGNQVNAVSKDGYTLSALSQDAVSGTFKNYATSNFNNNSGYYHRVYLGSCTERVYSSNPSNKPVITLSGTPQVTSTVEQSIRAQGELSISATKLAANATITLTSDNADVYFATDKTANFSKATKPITPLTLKADEKGKLAMTTVYVHYKPTSTSTLGVQTANITATTGTDGQPDYATATTIAALRNLPAKFVIATKVGATWYALPANMNGATNPEGVIIEVDETTMNATVPNTTVYTLFPVKTTTGSEDRYAQYGDRVRFSAVNNGYNGLWTSSSESTIRNYAVINDVRDGSSDASYEWKITTTIVDGNWQYTLQTDQSNNQKYLRYWTAASGGAKWGTYASGNDKLYFLPVTETKPFDYKVVEWYPTKVLIQTEAAITNPIVKIGGILVDKVTCTNKGGKLYEISGLPLVNNPTKVLTLSYTADEVTYTNSKVVPIILSRETKSISGEPFVALTKEVYNYADLVVRDGATLTMDGTQEANTLWDVTIYPTSKISVPESKKLIVHSLTFFGGIDEIYNGSTYTLNKYGVPELSLKGSLKKSISTIDYLMRVNLDQMYSLSVPYDVQLADIKYWDGSDIALGDALYVSAYDGAARANQSKKTWIYETDFESRLGAATLKAGVGYTISAELQAGVGNEYSILRMPMMSNVASGATEAAKTVAVTAWGKDANVTDNHKGWNLVGNPYMTTIQGADDDDLVLGYLKETGTGPWEWVEKTYRYVTIPSDDGTYYWQQKFTDAVLPPFKNFFVQVGTTGELVFDLGTRQSMPARSTQAAIEKEVEFEILMSNDARQDNTGLLISEEYSPAYEINADLEKMIGSMSVYTIYGGYKLAYNALSPINASEWIPMGYVAPAAGEYTFRLDDIDKIVEQVEHVYLIDYEANNIVDLMDDEYEFTTDKEQNNNRFAINIVLIQDKDNTTTGMDIINGNVAAPIKFIYHDKMYIQSGGVIYDGTGKQVTNINK